MFKGFQTKSQQFNGFPNINFGMDNQAYGFSGCTFWLSSEYGLNTNTDLAAVSRWEPRIGINTFTQSTGANQGYLVASDVNFNSYPVVKFDAADYMSTSYDVYYKGRTVCFVASYDTLNTVQNLIWSSVFSLGPGPERVCMGGAYNGGGSNIVTGIGAYIGVGQALVSTVEDTNPHIVVMNGNYLIIDGVLVTTGTWNQDGVIRQLAGESASGSTYGLTGRIADLIVYNRRLSSADCIMLSDNVNLKYAIY